MRKRFLRRAARGVTLVEVLIVVAIMAVIGGGVAMMAVPEFHKTRVKMASMGAATVREVAMAFRELDDGGLEGGCPTMEALIAARKIDPRKADDPWGSKYRIVCEDGDVRVFSAGRDKRHQTPDDVADGLKTAEIEAIAKR